MNVLLVINDVNKEILKRVMDAVSLTIHSQNHCLFNALNEIENDTNTSIGDVELLVEPTCKKDADYLNEQHKGIKLPDIETVYGKSPASAAKQELEDIPYFDQLAHEDYMMVNEFDVAITRMIIDKKECFHKKIKEQSEITFF